jgi:hypothetical protein
MKRVLISGIIIGLFIDLGTIAAILYGNGYRFDLSGNGTGNVKFLEGTGLLVATSKPDGARVFINDHLTTATNNTINLAPGTYDVSIQKDGYLPWKKKITIKKGLVSEANALLLATAPKLEAVTTIGIQNVTMDDSNSLLAYTVASASASKNGIYVLNMNSGPLVFLGASGTQIVNDLIDQFSSAILSFSPDGKQVLAKLPTSYYLLNASGSNSNPQDVTNTLLQVQNEFDQQTTDANKKVMDTLPRKLKPIALKYFKNIEPSPDGNRLLYTASASATLAKIAKPDTPSVNSTPDHRKITEGNVYVYDIKEDKNYEVADNSNLKEDQAPVKFYWYADSRHLVNADNDQIKIREYDGGNVTTVFAGSFLDSLVFPWPDGSSIGIVSRLSNSVPYNIYRISLQ